MRIGDALINKACIQGVRRRVVLDTYATDLVVEILVVSDESIPGWVEVEKMLYSMDTSWCSDPWSTPEVEQERQQHLKKLAAVNAERKLKALTRYRKIAVGLGFDPDEEETS